MGDRKQEKEERVRKGNGEAIIMGEKGRTGEGNVKEEWIKKNEDFNA